jgi:hypothetical protein
MKKIKNFILEQAFKKGILLDRLEPSSKLKNFIKRFSENYINVDLIRVGGDEDGGYLLTNNLDEVKYCFSLGVGGSINFEKELSQSYGIKSFMADGSDDIISFSEKNLLFTKKYIGSRTYDDNITLTDFIFSSIGNSLDNKILQMDIEGSEYEILSYESIETLSSFTTLIIEFHELQKLFQAEFLRSCQSIFEKIYLNFSICHVHPNNCCGIAEIDQIKVPRVMEVTFIRKDLVSRFKNNTKNISVPHKLDVKNMKHLPDVKMPENWYKNN